MSGVKRARKSSGKNISPDTRRSEARDESLDLKINTELLQQFLKTSPSKKGKKKPILAKRGDRPA